jgi:hypothetical protein
VEDETAKYAQALQENVEQHLKASAAAKDGLLGVLFVCLFACSLGLRHREEDRVSSSMVRSIEHRARWFDRSSINRWFDRACGATGVVARFTRRLFYDETRATASNERDVRDAVA